MKNRMLRLLGGTVLCALVLIGHGNLLLFARTDAPALTSDMLAGLRLRHIGPATMSGRIVDIAVVESNPFTFYIASATGGLWKTTDNGVTFMPVFTNQPTHSIGAVTVHQTNPDVVWVGTGERANRQSSSWGDGVYKSTDAGKTWTSMGLRDTHHIGRIVLHPRDPARVYVAALGHLWGPNDERGLFKSTDGGRTWSRTLFVDQYTGVTDVAMDPSDPETLYAATYQRQRTAFGFHGGGPGSGLHKTTDGGTTWTKLTNGLPGGDVGRIGISVYRKDPRIVYAAVEQGLRYNASTAYEARKAGVYRSDDGGNTWRHMSDWNPRPMYASQILVDPSDDKRVYMVNEYSYSDDGGKTFRVPRQSLHGDDRIVWVNPHNSKHVIKGDDGGVGISYDRGLKWLYVSSLPVSQYYRVRVDNRKPFWVYGGLQDNGSWAGPSATYFSSGILNEDWFRTGGGDGFLSIVDPTDDDTLYAESQFLGLTRINLRTREVRDIRPAQPQGFIQARRNWATWGKPDVREPLLGNAMAPANWDAPFILSPHDARTIYAGTNVLWKSTNRGDTWVSLGNLTTGVDRSTLKIMGQTPSTTTLSLDDGVPYYPTISAIGESPLKRGLLYVGTDDGNLQVSHDDGKSWTNVAPRIPGLPRSSWVASIEPSRHSEGTVYVAFDNHASDDYRNYLFRSTDYGRSWTSLTGDLPANRVVKTVREDLDNRNLLYAGTEFGFFISIDEGRHWVELQTNMPRLAINDFVIHPRDNDLVLATHGRGVWILDNIASLQELTPAVLESEAHLFSIESSEMIRYSNPKAHAGDMIFRGENPPAGAIIDYYLHPALHPTAQTTRGGDPALHPTAQTTRGGDPDLHPTAQTPGAVLTIHAANGDEVRRLDVPGRAGINRAVWDLRYAPLPPLPRTTTAPEEEDPERRPRPIPGPFVMPGRYIVRLQVGGRTYERPMDVGEDPRVEVTAANRRVWTETLLDIADVYRRVSARVEALGKTRPPDSAGTGETERVPIRELQTRLSTLYNAISRYTGVPTDDQRAQLEYFKIVSKELGAK